VVGGTRKKGVESGNYERTHVYSALLPIMLSVNNLQGRGREKTKGEPRSGELIVPPATERRRPAPKIFQCISYEHRWGGLCTPGTVMLRVSNNKRVRSWR